MVFLFSGGLRHLVLSSEVIQPDSAFLTNNTIYISSNQESLKNKNLTCQTRVNITLILQNVQCPTTI